MKQLSLGRNRLLTRIWLALFGTFLVAIGIRLIVLGNMGADALSTLILGLMNHAPWQFGTFSLLINILILIVTFFKNREMIGIASLINSFGIGLFLNGFDFLGILQKLPHNYHLLGVILGTSLFAFGTALYLLTMSGSGAYDCLMVQLKNQFKLSIRAARILLDGTFMLIGFLLGGTVGLGTVIVLVLLGVLIDWFMVHLPKFFPKFFAFN
ncbi:MAG: YczE/YyaS/YitT family protein [Enterococcus sp.]